MSIESNMELLNEMFDIEYDSDDNISIDKDKYYYIGKAEKILLELNNIDYYFHFLKIIMKNINKLNEDQKDEIIKLFNIKPQEKIIKKYIYKKCTKNNKPKLNTLDDY